MLKKLFIYDMKTLAKTQIPCLISIVGCGLLALLLSIAIAVIPADFGALAIAPAMLWIFSVLGAAITTVVAYIFILMHFYKKFFTDEGYLTFMFPATIETQYLSKVLSGVVYWFAIEIALILALVLALFLPATALLSFLSDFITSDSALSSLFMTEVGLTVTVPFWQSFLSTLLSVFNMLITPFSQIILYFTAITLGSLFFSKHKILGSVLFYFLSNITVNIITAIVQVLTLLPANAAENLTMSSIIASLSNIIMMILIAIIGYLISITVLHKKLNLE